MIIILFNFLYGRAQESDSVKTEKEIKREKIIVPWFVERFKISAGGFYVVNRTNIQVGINGMDATPIDAEKDLGLHKEVGTFLANFQWRQTRRLYGRKHRRHSTIGNRQSAILSPPALRLQPLPQRD